MTLIGKAKTLPQINTDERGSTISFRAEDWLLQLEFPQYEVIRHQEIYSQNPKPFPLLVGFGPEEPSQAKSQEAVRNPEGLLANVRDEIWR
jgi:hypothetical protein